MYLSTQGKMKKSSSSKMPDPSCVNLSVHSQDGNKMFFKIRRDTPIKKLLTAYYNKKFLEYKTVRFLINGERFDHRENPNELESQDGDKISVLETVFGGGYGIV